MQAGKREGRMSDHDRQRPVFDFGHPATFLAFWNWNYQEASLGELVVILSGAGMPVCCLECRNACQGAYVI